MLYKFSGKGRGEVAKPWVRNLSKFEIIALNDVWLLESSEGSEKPTINSNGDKIEISSNPEKVVKKFLDNRFEMMVVILDRCNPIWSNRLAEIIVVAHSKYFRLKGEVVVLRRR